MAPHSRLVLLLAHNEGECIARTVGEVRAALPSWDILVVDDGSEDDTSQQARNAGAMVARHPINLGVAAAEATGLMFAGRKGHQLVIRMDGDGQHDPQAASNICDAILHGADLVVGSRFLGVSSFRSTCLRRLGNQLLASLLSALCRQPITDPTSGFRGFSTAAIHLFAPNPPHDYPEPESIYMATRRGLRVQEVPVRMRPRMTGTSSLTPLRSAFYMLKVAVALVLERLRTVQ